MEKLKTEQGMSQRLRDYIDNILSKIMEYSPEILEICTSGGSSSGKQASRSNRASINNDSRKNSISSSSKNSSTSKFWFIKLYKQTNKLVNKKKHNRVVFSYNF